MIPIPAIGHLPPVFEFSKRLISQTNRLSVTIVLIRTPFAPEIESFSDSLAASCDPDRIKFIRVSGPNIPPLESIKSAHTFFPQFLDSQKDAVREALLADRAKQSGSSVSTGNPLLAGFVFDMFCSALMGTAAEFGVPAYVFSPPNATFLGFVFHVQKLHDEERVDTTELPDSVGELAVPCLTRPVPRWALPDVVADKVWLPIMLGHTRRIREAKGILVNTFRELESYALDSMGGDDCIPPIYPVGPVVNLEIDDDDRTNEIFRWLDDQPDSSVVFLCFGTMGTFGEDQVREIAYGLEQSGHRFLWVLRRPPSDHEPKSNISTDYDDLIDILPEGFSDRTVEAGRVVGWAPQKAILAHKAIGGFVSHCGWNSILESLWFAVPIAAWPMYAEQQLNAFQLVVELELATEMKLSYRMKGENDMIVSASEIERGIRRLMEEGMEKRVKWEEMSEMARKTLMVSGSSFSSTGRFVRDFLG
ncbi:unnamed protein product [Linum tenue]|uniref:Glycosyltransferase n=1 Tax=Linum tenue TaxID=586396 RepID=A0AAV0M1I8_9ROSI|nr:unnamed protein product [Linum tenue]